MRLIGFNFKKISIERLNEKLKNLRIESKINIESIDTVETDFIRKEEKIIRIKFLYVIDYLPDIAKVELQGQVLFSVSEAKAKEIINEWKEKKLNENDRLLIFNIILKKSNIKALQLEDEMNLPPHIPLPSIKKQNK